MIQKFELLDDNYPIYYINFQNVIDKKIDEGQLK